LAEYFKFLAADSDALVADISDLLKKKSSRISSESESIQAAKQFIFRLTEAVSFSFIQKTANALCSENLHLTHRDVRNANNFISADLIDLAIKVDYMKEFPLGEVKAFLRTLDKNHIVAHAILRDIALYKMYMFEIPRHKIQQICSTLRISVGGQARQRAFAKEKGISNA